ncbi:berberine bridge enzyme-like 4 [Quercus suber]|uniref:Berberine bridge enzyme-like 3 n=1 Tax=Quercus suber TaxID=58331 RepID=A0AAW0JZ80_QUESU
MKSTSPILLLGLAILMLSLSCAIPNPVFNNFFPCLSSHSSPLYPISEVFYSSNNSSFLSVLHSYIRNRRFSTSATPKPFAIVSAKHEFHIQSTLICAKQCGLQVRIRSGGHDYEGLSYVSQVPFVVLDMFNLRSIDIDIAKSTAWVQAGATLGELYYRISEKSNVHAFPAGVCVGVGTGGHFSGGGYGNLMRKYGLSVDNIIDAQLVIFNGTILNRESMGEDVFWAIRGGGGASFGVILSWKIKLVPVPAKVTVFNKKWTIENNATDVVYRWQQVAHKLPNEIFIRAVAQVVNGGQKGKMTVQVSFVGHFLGQSNSLIPLMNERFPELGLLQTDCIEMSWIESTIFWADLTNGTSIDALLKRASEPDIFFKAKSDYVKKPITKAGLESIWKSMTEIGFRGLMEWNPYGGRMSEILESETPFPHRAGNIFQILYYVTWVEEGTEVSNHYINLTRTFYNAMTSYVSKDPREAYLNYRDLDIGHASPNGNESLSSAKVYGAKYFKENFDRLVRVKTIIDPDNFFKNEQSIPPLPPYV